MSRTRWAAALLVLVGALAALGCGSSDDPSSVDSAGPGATAAAADGPPLGEHWHVAFAVSICGQVQPAPDDRGSDRLGIHTHGDGIIHAHPFLPEAAEGGADLGAFFDQIGLDVGDDSVELAGRTLTPDDGCDGEPGAWRAAQWDDAREAADGDEPDRVLDQDLTSIPLAPDLSAVTLSYAVGGEDAPAPPSAAEICTLAAADGGTTGSSPCGEQASTATVPISSDASR